MRRMHGNLPEEVEFSWWCPLISFFCPVTGFRAKGRQSLPLSWAFPPSLAPGRTPVDDAAEQPGSP